MHDNTAWNSQGISLIPYTRVHCLSSGVNHLCVCYLHVYQLISILWTIHCLHLTRQTADVHALWPDNMCSTCVDLGGQTCIYSGIDLCTCIHSEIISMGFTLCIWCIGIPVWLLVIFIIHNILTTSSHWNVILPHIGLLCIIHIVWTSFLFAPSSFLCILFYSIIPRSGGLLVFLSALHICYIELIKLMNWLYFCMHTCLCSEPLWARVPALSTTM